MQGEPETVATREQHAMTQERASSVRRRDAQLDGRMRRRCIHINATARGAAMSRAESARVWNEYLIRLTAYDSCLMPCRAALMDYKTAVDVFDMEGRVKMSAST